MGILMTDMQSELLQHEKEKPLNITSVKRLQHNYHNRSTLDMIIEIQLHKYLKHEIITRIIRNVATIVDS